MGDQDYQRQRPLGSMVGSRLIDLTELVARSEGTINLLTKVLNAIERGAPGDRTRADRPAGPARA